MLDTITKYMPMLLEGSLVTIYMTLFSAILAYLIGVPMGIALFITKANGIAENKVFNAVFGWVINILRSIPFVILMMALFPITRIIVGTIIGPNAAIVALAIAAAPFVARLVEQSLEELDIGVIEAARCMGASNVQIIFKVLLSESMPGIVRGMSITVITLIGYGAMAGALGAGGLGDIALRYGLHRFEPTVMYITVILIVILVCIIQAVFNIAAKRIDKKNK